MTATDRSAPAERAERTTLICSACGYGIVRPTPPESCPMCRTTDAWSHPRRPPAGIPLAGVERV